MRLSFFLIPLLFSYLFAAPIDPTCKKFESKEREQVRVDTFDFTGEYPDLKKIEIDATKKMRVELLLPGIYPELKSVRYDGSFGALNGKLTGAFPQLEQVAFLCGSTCMNLDFSGEWQKSCKVAIKADRGDIMVKLPSGVGVIVETKTGVLKGKVEVKESGLIKEKRGIKNKRYVNSLANSHPITVHFMVELNEGRLTLLSEETQTPLNSPSRETFLEGQTRKSHPLLRVN